MATKVKSYASDSKSGHADNASMSNQVTAYKLWQEIANKAGQELVWKALKASNFAGYARLSALPSVQSAHMLFAFSGGVWGNHPYHSDLGASLKLIADKSIDAPTRFEIAQIMLQYPDKGMHWAIKDAILEKAGFSVDQLITLGLRTPEVKVTPPANVVNENEIIARLAKKLGISYADAVAFANSDDVEPETVAPKGKAKTAK